jgi:uncharacterized repeat protein (TIGR04138 family)
LLITRANKTARMAEVSILELAKKYGRFSPEAYLLVRDSLAHAVELHGLEQGQHLTAAQLVAGALDLANERWGGMAQSVLQRWGIFRSEDIGLITFQFIEVGVFGKQDSDSHTDFENGVDFTSTLAEATRKHLHEVDFDDARSL